MIYKQIYIRDTGVFYLEICNEVLGRTCENDMFFIERKFVILFVFVG